MGIFWTGVLKESWRTPVGKTFKKQDIGGPRAMALGSRQVPGGTTPSLICKVKNRINDKRIYLEEVDKRTKSKEEGSPLGKPDLTNGTPPLQDRTNKREHRGAAKGEREGHARTVVFTEKEGAWSEERKRLPPGGWGKEKTMVDLTLKPPKRRLNAWLPTNLSAREI